MKNPTRDPAYGASDVFGHEINRLFLMQCFFSLTKSVDDTTEGDADGAFCRNRLSTANDIAMLKPRDKSNDTNYS
jgi:hypothetical protein